MTALTTSFAHNGRCCRQAWLATRDREHRRLSGYPTNWSRSSYRVLAQSPFHQTVENTTSRRTSQTARFAALRTATKLRQFFETNTLIAYTRPRVTACRARPSTRCCRWLSSAAEEPLATPASTKGIASLPLRQYSITSSQANLPSYEASVNT